MADKKDLLSLMQAPPSRAPRSSTTPAPRTTPSTTPSTTGTTGTTARVRLPPKPKPELDALTVTQLTLRMKTTLEGFGDLAVRGEVSGMKVAQGGHWYFDLKDKHAKISVVVFFKDTRRSPRPPAEGETVVVTGPPTYHPAFGKAQLVAKLVLPEGEGDLNKKHEALKQKLADEGLFDVSKKRPLPLLARTIGVVTSPTGAAIKDVLTVLGHRAPHTAVIVAPTRVQGEGAPADVADAIRRLDRLRRCDVILVVRGGGAREDLHAFNSEPVVRAIANASVPVVAGVGHEVDVTLADLVADVRAATPSQAAELAAPRHDELHRRIDALAQRLRSQARANLDRGRRRLVEVERRLPAPPVVVAARRRQLARLEQRLGLTSPQAQLSKRSRALTDLEARLAAAHPENDVARAVVDVDALAARLTAAVRRRANDADVQLQRAIEQLDALSPTAVLRRGWALVTVAGNDVQPVRKEHLVPGARVRIRVEGGDATAVVEGATASTASTSTKTPP